MIQVKIENEKDIEKFISLYWEDIEKKINKADPLLFKRDFENVIKRNVKEINGPDLEIISQTFSEIISSFNEAQKKINEYIKKFKQNSQFLLITKLNPINQHCNINFRNIVDSLLNQFLIVLKLKYQKEKKGDYFI